MSTETGPMREALEWCAGALKGLCPAFAREIETCRRHDIGARRTIGQILDMADKALKPPSAQTTMIADERTAFEAWASAAPFECDLDRYDDHPLRMWPGQYKHHTVQMAWEGWQARAAQESAQQGGGNE